MPNRTNGDEPPFRPWEGDHTDLVRLLNAARAKGLSLMSSDANELAEMILASRWLAAREAHAITRAEESDGRTPLP